MLLIPNYATPTKTNMKEENLKDKKIETGRKNDAREDDKPCTFSSFSLWLLTILLHHLREVPHVLIHQIYVLILHVILISYILTLYDKQMFLRGHS